MRPIYTCLNTADAEIRTEYEQAFYRAFVRVRGNNSLIRDLWLWDDYTCRLVTRIPYEEQLIFAELDAQGRIETAIASNIALHDFQSLAFGFPPPLKRAGCCEFLTFFTEKNFGMKSKIRYWRACFGELRRHGLHTAYATTGARVLPLYRWIGGYILQQTGINGEGRWFMRFDLNRTRVPGG